MYNQDVYYSQDIFEFNRQKALPAPLPPGEEGNRGHALAWMRDTSRELNLIPLTWNLAVAYLDRFLAARFEKVSEFYLSLSCAALHLASLMEELYIIPIDSLADLTNPIVSSAIVVERELELAELLRYTFRIPTVADFLRYFDAQWSAEIPVVWSEAKLLGEMACISASLSGFHPALLATACLAFLVPEKLPMLAGRAFYEIGEVENCRDALVAFLYAIPSGRPGVLKAAKSIEATWGLQVVALLERLAPRGGRAELAQPNAGAAPAAGQERGEEEIKEILALGPEVLAEKLGEGAYGEVRALRIAGLEYAAKIYPEVVEEGLEPYFAMETSVARLLASDHIVKAAFSGVVDLHPYLVMELCSRDLESEIKLWPRANDEETLRLIGKYTTEILKAVAYIHATGLVHCDLKPRNILVCDGKAKLAGEVKTAVSEPGPLSEPGLARSADAPALRSASSAASAGPAWAQSARLADFGSAQWQTPPFRTMASEVAALWYRAPEHFLSSLPARPSTDLWSLGCIIYKMAKRHVAFEGGSAQEILHLIYTELGQPSVADMEKMPWLKKSYETASPLPSRGPSVYEERPPPPAAEGEEEKVATMPVLLSGLKGQWAWIEDVIAQCFSYDPDQRTPAKLLLNKIPRE